MRSQQIKNRFNDSKTKTKYIIINNNNIIFKNTFLHKCIKYLLC